MEYLVTSEEMKKYDTYTINEIGIPGIVLMERAALFTTGLILDYCESLKKRKDNLKVLIVCGQGNNGGDGLAVARLLLDHNCNVAVCFVGDREKAGPEVRNQLHILKKYGVVPSYNFPESEYDVIVDALFGIGLSREITGEYATVIHKMNSMSGWKIAIDIPSGIDATTGKVHGTAFQADVTATFAYGKRGLYFYPGAEYAGEVIIGQIGITDRSFAGKLPEMYTYDEKIPQLLRKRNPAGNKGTFGKVLILAGSHGMAGAALLCSKAAFRSGAGMVKLVSADENQLLIQKSLPEVMFLGYDEKLTTAATPDREEWCEKLSRSLEWCDCILAGPGMGTSVISEMLLREVFTFLEKDSKPLVLDADALNLIAQKDDLKDRLLTCTKKENQTVVMTPHVGELSRLLDCSISEVKEDFLVTARTAARKYNCIMVCKDARTLVCEKEGPVYLNVCGNSGMATAGSGDVLSGIIAALYGAASEGMKQAALGVYLHGKAGDFAAVQKGEAALMASDIIEVLSMIQKGN